MKILKRIWIGAASLALVFALLDAFWIMSGSNKWELAVDKDGVKVYTLKSPGSSIVQFKGVTRYTYTYSQMFAMFIDDSSFADSCEKLVPGCVEYRFISKWNPQLLTNAQYWRMDFPFPFADREMVLNGKIYQDPKSKVVLLENSAAPNLILPNGCCVTVRHLHNTWRYTPVGNGQVEVEYINDVDLGGLFPDFLVSLAGVDETYKLLHDIIPNLLDNMEQYKNIKLGFIVEYK